MAFLGGSRKGVTGESNETVSHANALTEREREKETERESKTGCRVRVRMQRLDCCHNRWQMECSFI